MDNTRKPALSRESSYTHLYAIGDIEHSGIPAVIVKSPLVRRLQRVHYFGDLARVLETTYEQHIVGTSEIMREYPLSLINLSQRIFAHTIVSTLGLDREKQEAVYRELDGLFSQYKERVGEVAPISSLIGMLATPPYRQPFGTYAKREFVKILVEKLQAELEQEENENKSFVNLLSSIRNDLVEIFSMILLESRKNRSSLLFKPVFLDRIRSLVLGSDPLNFTKKGIDLEKYEEAFIHTYLSRVREFYWSRITPWTYDIKDPFILYQAPSIFLLRYRSMSSMLGLGLIASEIAKSIFEEFLKSRNEPSEKLSDIIANELDELYKVMEAILINHSASISSLSDIVEVEDNNGDKIIRYSLLGLNNYFIEYDLNNPFSILIKEKSVEDWSIKPLSEKHSDPKVFNSIRLITNPSDTTYHDLMFPCCILSIKPVSINIGSLDHISPDAWYTKELGMHILSEALKRRGLLEISRLLEKSNTHNENEIETIESIANVFTGMGVGGRSYPFIVWNPFISHFKLNLIQSDMIPSAYQLDLLHRLDKDINVGERMNYENLSELVFTLDVHALRTYMLLSVIYTNLFSDLAIISQRLGLIHQASKTIPRQRLCSLIKNKKDCMYLDCMKDAASIDLFSIIHFYLISKQLHEYSNKVKNYLDKISIINRNLHDYQAKATIEYIVELLETVRRLIKNYNRLLMELISYRLEKYGCNETLETIKVIDDIISHRQVAPNISDDITNEIDSFMKVLLGLYIGSNSRASLKSRGPHHNDVKQVVVHGVVNFYELALNSSKKNILLPKHFNLAAMLASKIIQGTHSGSLEEAFKRKAKELCGLNISSIGVQLPVQGVLKHYFHLPYEFTQYPEVASASDIHSILKIIHDEKQENTESPIKRVEKRYKKVFKELANYLSVYDSKPLKETLRLIEQTAPSIPNTDFLLLPDAKKWRYIGYVSLQDSAIDSSHPLKLKQGVNMFYTEVSPMYPVMYIIYWASVTVDEESENRSIIELQRCIVKSIGETVFDVLKEPKTPLIA